jgi:primosomal protein N' (replication factor Y)
MQTYHPEHYLFKYLLQHDYLGFFAQEIRMRREFGYPPFSRLINVLFQGNRESGVKQVAESAAEGLRGALITGSARSPLEILGPVPAPIEKIRGKYRYHLLLKGEDSRAVHRAGAFIQQFERQWTRGRGVQIILDVDPVDML